jgi:hypothetical protein
MMDFTSGLWAAKVQRLKSTENDNRVTKSAYRLPRAALAGRFGWAEPTPAQEAVAITRRKKLYEELYPETKGGGDRKSEKARSDRQNDDLKADRFTKDTASKTGKSERARCNAKRGVPLGG